MRSIRIRDSIVMICVTASVCLPVLADNPSVSYIFPAGGQRGTTVNFRIGGHYLHNDCPFEMLGEGVTAVDRLTRAAETTWFEGPLIPLTESQQKEDYPVDHLGTVQISANASVGIRRWRVHTSQGVTSSLPFIVGDFPEFVEQEIDGRPLPTLIDLPITINGRIFPREDIDIWSFDALAGETYVCDVFADRMRSPLDSRLKIIGPSGQTLAENDDARGKDSRIGFTAEHAGRHEVHLWDADLGGLQHYVYRLTITRGPLTEAIYPLGGRRGETLALERIGPGVVTGDSECPISLDAAERMLLSGSGNVWLETSDHDELREQEPNDSADVATGATLNAVWNGRIQVPGDVDVWQFTGSTNIPIEFDLYAARLGSPLDSVLSIFDAAGKLVAESDDLAAGQTDSRLSFNPPSDANYTAKITERFSKRGNASFGYRLHVHPAASHAPSFSLKLPADALNLARGAESQLKIIVDRQHGFAGAIQLTVDGLPMSVVVSEATVAANQNEATLTFMATLDAVVGVSSITVRGRSDIDGILVEKIAVVPAVVPEDLVVDHVRLAVTMPTPFKVVGVFETKYAPRGSTYVRHYRIERGGFEGALRVQLAERQARHLQGVTGQTIEIAAGVNEFDFQVHLPPWMEIGRTSRTCLMAIGEITLADGSSHTVSYTSHEQNDQIIVLVDPSQLSLKLEHPSVRGHAGESIELPFEIRRGPELAGDVHVELISPLHLTGISSTPLDIPEGRDLGHLRIEFASELLRPLNMPFVVRATVMQNGRPYTAEAILEIIINKVRVPQ